MTKTILIAVAVFAVTMQAQNNFQNPAWLGAANNAQKALRPEGQAGPVTGKPFSGTETRQTRQMLSDGTLTNKTSVSKVFRDAEGRMRSDSGADTILFDAPNHVSYTIGNRGCMKRSVHENDSITIVAMEHETHSHSEGGTGVPRPDSGIVTEDLGFQAINGISAKGSRQTVMIPLSILGSDHDVKVVHEQWYSESLGILVKSSNIDPRFGNTTYELSDVNLSAPDASLFVPPAGCAESQGPGLRRQISDH